MNYKGVAKRGAYAGVSALFLMIPVYYLDALNVVHSLNVLGKDLLSILFIATTIAGLFINLAFIELARRYRSKLLLITTYLLVITAIMGGLGNVVHVWNMSGSFLLVRGFVDMVTAFAVFSWSFGIAGLAAQYGKIALSIRNLNLLYALGLFLSGLLKVIGSQDSLLVLILEIVVLIGTLAILINYFLIIRLLLRAAKSE